MNLIGVKDNTVYIHTDWRNNKFLPKEFIEQRILTLKETDILQYEYEFLGHWKYSNKNALITNAELNNAKRSSNTTNKLTDYEKIVIAVDPAVSFSDKSDATGIIVAGKIDDMFYIIEEKTGVYKPNEWAKIIGDLYNKYSASKIVYENNQGGLLVEQTIRNIVGNFCLIESVRATKGKILRAEPVAALYKQGKVIHNCKCPILEKELLTYTRR